MKYLSKSLPFAFVAGSLLFGCGPVENETSETSFQVGPVGPGEGCEGVSCNVGIVGHEAMTVMSKTLANRFLGSTVYGLYGDSANTPGVKANCPIVQGNFATDKPDPMVDKIDLRAFQASMFHIDPKQDWHEGGDRQVFHSLRNYNQNIDTVLIPGTNQRSIETNLQTCERVKSMITVVTKEAMKNWQKDGENFQNKLLIGTLTHTIQDSFSIVHVKRDESWKIKEYCKFGEEIKGICYHSAVDAVIHDYIWDPSVSVNVMKPEAKRAAITTAAYLMHIYKIGKDPSSLDRELADFFAGSPALHQEYPGFPETAPMNCDSLLPN